MDTAKRFELLLTKNSINANDIRRAYPLVEDHIAGVSPVRSNCILVGGSAIDFAMRLKGKQLYPDSALEYNDYDYWHDDAVLDSYKLGMQLHNAEVGDVSVITAGHFSTMSVVVGGLRIADETYVPPSIFEKIPTILYSHRRGKDTLRMKIISPMVQIINMHMAIAYPYRNPPREVYNQRITKDISRYNMLWDLYIRDHLKAQRPKSTIREVTITEFLDIPNSLYVGFLAHANILRLAKFKPRNVCKFENGTLTLDWVDGVPIPVDVYVADNGQIDATHHRMLDWFPKSHKHAAGDVIFSKFISRNDLVPMVECDGQKYACIQHTLMYFAIHATFGEPKMSPLWWTYYNDCIDALNELTPSDIALFGADVWPDRQTVTMSESDEFWATLTSINIEAGGVKERTAEKSEALKFMDKRPASVNFNMRNVDTRMKYLLQWDYSSEYFQLDGSPIDTAASRSA